MDVSHTSNQDRPPDSRLRRLSSSLVLGLLMTLSTPGAWASDPADTEESTTLAPDSPAALAETTEDASVCGCCGRGKRAGKGSSGSQGAGCRMGRGARSAEGSPGGHRGRPEMQLAHFLIDNHDRLERTVEVIPGGVRTRTTTDDPELVDALRRHVRQMAALIHDGGRIRNWDPLFREIFDRREAIEIQIDDLEDGVEVTETSSEAEVARLIQAHARKVDEFVARGRAAYREETPLPEGYGKTSP